MKLSILKSKHLVVQFVVDILLINQISEFTYALTVAFDHISVELVITHSHQRMNQQLMNLLIPNHLVF